MGQIQESIETKIAGELQPECMEVVNESHTHNVPPNSETHFRILVVSSVFEGMGRVDRHRKLQSLLVDEFAGELHAVNLKLMTVSEWEKASGGVKHQSPNCSHKPS